MAYITNVGGDRFVEVKDTDLTVAGRLHEKSGTMLEQGSKSLEINSSQNIYSDGNGEKKDERLALTSTKGKTLITITNKESGHAIVGVRGLGATGEDGIERDLQFDRIIVPTYECTVTVDEKKYLTFHVTRDSWFSRSEEIEKRNIKFIKGSSKGQKGQQSRIIGSLTNRCFEPAKDGVEYVAELNKDYPHDTGIVGFTICNYIKKPFERGGNYKILDSLPHTNEMNTYKSGSNISDARTSLAKATAVMIHIAGHYNNIASSKPLSRATSFGCFGVIVDSQRLSNHDFAKVLCKDDALASPPRIGLLHKKYFEPSNQEYNKLTNKILKIHQNHGNGLLFGEEMKVIVQKRKNMDKRENQIKAYDPPFEWLPNLKKDSYVVLKPVKKNK
jgi:hypothetical protein